MQKKMEKKAYGGVKVVQEASDGFQVSCLIGEQLQHDSRASAVQGMNEVDNGATMQMMHVQDQVHESWEWQLGAATAQ